MPRYVGTVRALFDFEAAHETELTFSQGDEWSVTRKNVGAGWWEGEKEGVLGLFPRNYVEVLEEETSESDSDGGEAGSGSGAATTTTAGSAATAAAAAAAAGNLSSNSSSGSIHTPPTRLGQIPQPTSPTSVYQQQQQQQQPQQPSAPLQQQQQPVRPDRPPAEAQVSSTATTTKTRAPSVLMQRAGSPSAGFPGTGEGELLLTDGRWTPTRQIFTTFVTNPEKRKKFSGVTTFIAYSVKTSLNGEVVSRRYKNFSWLHDRLTEQYPFVVIPSLPEKQIQGRFEESFVANRMRKLERFLNRVVLHPLLRSSAVLHHFVTSSDVKEWKEGKRSAEAEAQLITAYLDKHRITEAGLFDSSVNASSEIEKFSKHIKAMERNLQTLHGISEHLISARSDYYNNVGKMSEGLKHLARDDESSNIMLKFTEQLNRVSRVITHVPSVDSSGGSVAGNSSTLQSTSSTAPSATTSAVAPTTSATSGSAAASSGGSTPSTAKRPATTAPPPPPSSSATTSSSALSSFMGFVSGGGWGGGSGAGTSGAALALPVWCWRDGCTQCGQLTNALGQVSTSFGRMLSLHVQDESLVELSEDLKELLEDARKFKAIIRLRDAQFEAYKAATMREKDFPQIPLLKQRCDRASTLLLAEIHFYHETRGNAYQRMFQSLVQQQAEFHRRLANMWDELLPGALDIVTATFN